MKKTLLLFLLLPFLGFAQTPLSGDYIISNTNTDSNFKTLAAAVNRLNAVGVNAPVRFLLDENQTLTSLLSINSFSNTTSSTVTIKPNTGRTITINANMPDASNGVPAVIRINGSSNIIIDGSNSALNTKNLTLINNDNINYTARAIIWIASNGSTGSSNITVKNANFRFSTRNQQLTLLTGIYSGNNGIGGNNSISVQENTAANSNISIINNEMFNVKDGVNINGSATTSISPTGWKIQGNKIGTTVTAEKPVRGIYVSNALNYEISGNTLSGIRNTENQGNDCAAIVLLGTSTGTISSNIINDIVNTQHNNGTASAGIFVKTTATTNISNNIISNVYNTTADSNDYNFYNKASSIFVSSGSVTNIYYNTLIASGAPNGTSRAACLYTAGGSGINVKNNIFINTQANEQYAVFNNGGSFGQISNNDYYVTNSANNFLNRIGSTLYAGTTAGTVPAYWNSAASDSNSRNILPTFTSATDYHLQDATANNNLTAVAITGITTDFDGDTRVKPYMGADEVLKCVPTGDQTSFGNNTWTGYVYRMASNAALPPNVAYPALPSSTIATYIGTVTENKEFDRNVGTGAITGTTTNFACDTAPSDRFFVRYKMRTTITEAGLYSFDLGSDDGIRLFVDGVQVFTRWNQHGYTADYFTQNLSVGDHEFVLEYYEDGGEARVAFTSRLPKGDPTVFGDKVWNVYGYVNNDLTLTNTRYAGYYVDPNLNIESTTYWPRAKSPSVASNWQGALIPDNNFTTVFKRKGFPCGQYQIQRANYDDAIEIYIDGTLVFSRSGWDNNPALINNGALYKLNSNSRIEIRLREDGGDANLGINFIKKDLVYNGTGTLENGSSVVINANTTLTSDLTVCSCTINPNYTLTVPTNVTLTVDEDINVGTGGKLLIQSGGALLQTTTSKTMFTGNTTAFELQRTTHISRFDLTYWSTPVTNSTYTMHDLSPETLYDKYFHWDAAGTRWLVDPSGTSLVMQVGKGYSIRGPQSFDITTASDFTAKFNGTPNNGTIALAVEKDKYNLIGNPYPSAIDAQQLLDVSRNPDIGALYFWTHNSPPAIIAGTNTYRYSSSDYVVYTLTGSTRIDNSPIAKGFDGKIAAGQGFFVKPKTAVINFTNDIRKGAADNNQFYKTAKTTNLEANHIWLNLTNTEGAFKQLLVGYIEGATNGIDQNYDGISMSANTYIDFYSFNESKKLTVQGRALPFDDTDIVQLGYKSTIEGEFTIAIDHADGIFDTQEVYLEDKFTGIITDLRKENYTFKTAIGTSTTRFVLRYTNKTLGTDDFENTTNNVLVSVKSKVIKVNTGTENIKEVNIYNIGGQLIYNKNKVDSNELTISNLPSGNQVLLVKVILDNDREVTKKIIFN